MIGLVLNCVWMFFGRYFGVVGMFCVLERFLDIMGGLEFCLGSFWRWSLCEGY